MLTTLTHAVPPDWAITLEYWNTTSCAGLSVGSPILDWSNNTVLDPAVLSYKLSRNMNRTEFLDSSGHGLHGKVIGGVDPSCSVFLEKANPDSNNNLLLEEVCYGYLKGHTPACVRIWKSS